MELLAAVVSILTALLAMDCAYLVWPHVPPVLRQFTVSAVWTALYFYLTAPVWAASHPASPVKPYETTAPLAILRLLALISTMQLVILAAYSDSIQGPCIYAQPVRAHVLRASMGHQQLV